MRHYINLIESAQIDEAPYLGKKYVPVDIHDIIDYYNDGKGMFVSQQYPVIDPIAIQKLTRGATPVVKFKDGKYYTFTSEDDKTVTIIQIGQTNDNNFIQTAFNPKTLGVPYTPNNNTHFVDISMDDFLSLAESNIEDLE